nr:cupredoxin domain-containing protein [Thalassotalea sp. ND16A]
MLTVNLLGLGLIALIVWWFWLYKPKLVKAKNVQDKETSNEGEITVVVEDGVYQPAHISINENNSVRINFIRKDASPCAATVVFPDLDISAELPLNKPLVVPLPAMNKGLYAFHCQMKMYSGSLLVE